MYIVLLKTVTMASFFYLLCKVFLLSPSISNGHPAGSQVMANVSLSFSASVAFT